MNEHQRRVYEDFVCNDLSLSEIAAEAGISRQGVADMVKRCDSKLLSYEGRLHLLERFLTIKAQVEQIRGLCERVKAADRSSESPAEALEPEDIFGFVSQIEQISSQILEVL